MFNISNNENKKDNKNKMKFIFKILKSKRLKNKKIEFKLLK